MNFTSSKPIFLQIFDTIINQILCKEILPNERILSVRDMAIKISVNPNTVQRSYTELLNHKILEQKRGIGYFTTDNCYDLALKIRRDEFMQIYLPQLINQMNILNLSWDDLKSIKEQQT